MSNATPEELADNAKEPGSFSIVAALKDRAYPHDNVNVYIDEQSAYLAAGITERLQEIKTIETTNGFQLDEELTAEKIKLEAERDNLLSLLGENKYVFTITGISEGKREELLKKALDKYPMEQEQSTNPITNEVTKTDIELQERNDFFTELIWTEHITKITAPNGAVQTGLTLKDVQSIRPTLPVASVGLITEAIDKLRISTAVFMMKVDEDFLAKS